MPATGVDLTPPVISLNAWFWTISNLFRTADEAVIIGSHAYKHCWFNMLLRDDLQLPQLVVANVFRMLSFCLAFLVVLFIWFFQINLRSQYTPRYFGSLFFTISSLPIFRMYSDFV